VRLAAHGLTIDLPVGWSGRVFARAGANATLHAGDFPIAAIDGEFGDRSTASMPDGGSFVALAEYLPGSGLEPGRGLFAARRLPLPLDPLRFSPHRLAHPRSGQAGLQHFFSTADRPFCLYLVIAGGRAPRRAQLARLDHVLGSLQIAAR
jgi:hypothetical protein